MRQTNIYRSASGWAWEVRINSRVVIIGWARTRERAEQEAKLA